MIKKLIKDGYEIEYDCDENLSEEELNHTTDKVISLIKRKEAKDATPYLVYENGEIVKKGDEVVDFRGNKAIIESWQAPAFEGKSGRVYVEELLEGGKNFKAGYYPEVYGLKWKNLPWDNKVDDTYIEDVPINAPEENIDITYTEKLKGGKNALTYGMIEQAFKDRAKDEGKTFEAYIDVALESLKDDIENAKYIVSGEMKNTRKLLLEDYIKIEHLIQKAGLKEKLDEFKPLVDQLSEKLNLNYWKQPKFKKSEIKSAAKELRNQHRWDSAEKPYIYQSNEDAEPMFIGFYQSNNDAIRGMSNLPLGVGKSTTIDIMDKELYRNMKKDGLIEEEDIPILDKYFSIQDSKIVKSFKPVFLCTKTDLTASYNDAKQGKLPQVFEANLSKVQKDMEADYERIKAGKDNYTEDPRIVKVLPDIVDLYQTAIKYANELGYKEIGNHFNEMLEVIKEGWKL